LRIVALPFAHLAPVRGVSSSTRSHPTLAAAPRDTTRLQVRAPTVYARPPKRQPEPRVFSLSFFLVSGLYLARTGSFKKCQWEHLPVPCSLPCVAPSDNLRTARTTTRQPDELARHPSRCTWRLMTLLPASKQGAWTEEHSWRGTQLAGTTHTREKFSVRLEVDPPTPTPSTLNP
jgi:hypothetical protein